MIYYGLPHRILFFEHKLTRLRQEQEFQQAAPPQDKHRPQMMIDQEIKRTMTIKGGLQIQAIQAIEKYLGKSENPFLHFDSMDPLVQTYFTV